MTAWFRTGLGRLAAVLVVVVFVDLVVSAAVFVDRRDDPQVPDFRVRSGVAVDWSQDPFARTSPVLALSTELPRFAKVDSTGRMPVGNGVIRPPAVVDYALAALDSYRATGDARWVRRAHTAVLQVLAEAHDGLVAHRYRATDLLGRPVEQPWYAADTQAKLLSALAGLQRATGSPRWRIAADQVFAALSSFQGFFAGDRPAPVHWLSSVDTSGYLWFDRYSTGLASSRVLTEQLWTALGIYDYRSVLADRTDEVRRAERLFLGSVTTVTHSLHEWRVPGRISTSSLEAGNRDVREHFVAAAQLEMLSRVVDRAGLADAAAELARDSRVPFFPLQAVRALPGRNPYLPLSERLQTLAKLPSVPRAQTGHSDVDSSAAAEWALARLERPGSGAADVRAAAGVATELLAGADHGTVMNRYPIDDTTGHRVTEPWSSPTAQATLLGVLVRLHERTSDNRWSKAARRTFRGMLRVRDYGAPSPAPWSALIDYSGYLWFDQDLGSRPPPRLVAEHMAATVGLYDYWRSTADPNAFAYFCGAVTTLKGALPYIRRPGRSAVESLLTGAGDARNHFLVIERMQQIARVTDDQFFDRAVRRLSEDYP